MTGPTAVVCGNDVIAYGVLLEAERSGLRRAARPLRGRLRRSRLEPAFAAEPDHYSTFDRRDLAAAPANIWCDGCAGEQTIMHHEIDYSLVVREFDGPGPRNPTVDDRDDSHLLACPRVFAPPLDRRRRRASVPPSAKLFCCELGAIGYLATAVNEADLAQAADAAGGA